MDNFDLVVIGGGPGGYTAAIRAAQLGLRAALIEMRATLGGTCLNVGCIPSKCLLESSGHYERIRSGLEDHGISAGTFALDLTRMMARKDRVVRELTEGISALMKRNKIRVMHGRGMLAGPGRVIVRGEGGDEEVRAKHILLAMGSLPVEIPSLPFDGKHIVTSTEALCFETVPERMVVVGAGAVGLELGTVWSRLRAQVTVVEMLPTIAPFADRMMARTLEKALSSQGLSFRLESRIVGAQIHGDEIAVAVQDAKGATESLTCDKLLVSAGRRPCTAGAGLEAAGIRLDKGGRVDVDDRFRTSVAGVYAIGDLIRGPMLAHKAEEEGAAVAECIAGNPGHVDYGIIPSVVYTHPELAQAGLTEEEAKARGLPVKAGRFYFRANGRALCMGEDDGLVKVLSHAETGRILGVHIVGPFASEIISEAVVAMRFGGKVEDIARTVHAHPTLSEAVKGAAALAAERRHTKPGTHCR